MAVTLCLLVATSQSTSAEVIYRESMRDYALKGNLQTPQQIWQAIRKYGKTETDAASIRVGWANWRIGISYEPIQRGNLCSIANVRVKVDVLINVPQWQDQDVARRPLRRFFTCVRRTVTTHEIQHGDIARETGKSIERAYWNWLVDIPCNQFQDRANEIFERETERGKRAQANFDTQDYARNRYQVCDRLGAGEEVAAYMPPEINHPKRRNFKTGREWIERRAAVENVRDDELAARAVPAVINGDEPDPATAAQPDKPATPRQSAADPAPGLLSDLPPELRSTLFERLSGILAICAVIGLMIWYGVGRLKPRDNAKAGKPGALSGVAVEEAGHEPIWARQAAAALHDYAPAPDQEPETTSMPPAARKAKPRDARPRPTHAPTFGKRGRVASR